MAQDDSTIGSSSQAEDGGNSTISTKIEQQRKTLLELEQRRTELARQFLMTSKTEQNDEEHVDVSKAVAESKVVNQKRIDLLKQYNEIKDIGTGLIGMIAESKQQRMVDAMADFGMEADD